jgi:glutamate synthase (ferredoxin)
MVDMTSSWPRGDYESPREQPLSCLQRAFGYSYEDLRLILAPMVTNALTPWGPMGNDTPLAVLSEKPQLPTNTSSSFFAQVTNPPIDALREAIVTSSIVYLGAEKNLLKSEAESCHRIRLHAPIIDNEDLKKLRAITKPGFKSVTLPILFNAGGEAGP